MSDYPVEPAPEAPALTYYQKMEELKRQEEEARQKREEERLKREEEIKKLKEALKTGLSGLARTADCTSMCYNKLNLAYKELYRLYECLLDFKHVRYLDLSGNQIADAILVTGLPELVSINLSKNQVKSLDAFNQPNVLKKLQVLNISTNKILKLSQVALPSLRRLNLNYNEINMVYGWNGHDEIYVLYLRKNMLKKLTGLKGMKNLVYLYLSENQISDIRGLADLPNLKKLYLRNNKIKKIHKPFPYLPSLQHINLRYNQIYKIIEFQKLDRHVKSVTFMANPASDELADAVRKEMFWAYPHLERINKQPVTLEYKGYFEKEWKEKQAERYRERLYKYAQEAYAQRLAYQERLEKEAEAKKAEGGEPAPY